MRPFRHMHSAFPRGDLSNQNSIYKVSQWSSLRKLLFLNTLERRPGFAPDIFSHFRDVIKAGLHL